MADPSVVSVTPRARHSNLREFQQQLARRLQQACDARSALQDCIAVSSGRRHWLFDLACVAEVIAMPVLQTVPFTRPWYLGLIHHRGDLVGVVDLEQFTGAPASPRRETDRLLLLSSTLPVRCAVRLSRLAGIVDRSALRPAARDSTLPEWSPMSFEDADGIAHAWIDINALMRDPEFIDIGSR